MPRWDLVRGGCRNCGTVTCTIVLGWSNAQKVSAIRYAVQQAYVQFSATILQWQYGKAPLSYSRRSVRPLTHRIQRCPLVLHKISIGLLMYGRYRRWRRWRLPRQKIIWTVTQPWSSVRFIGNVALQVIYQNLRRPWHVSMCCWRLYTTQQQATGCCCHVGSMTIGTASINEGRHILFWCAWRSDRGLIMKIYDSW